MFKGINTTVSAWLTALLLALASSAALAFNPGGPADGETGSSTTGTGFPGVSSFAASGPYSTTTDSIGGGWFSASCTIFRPAWLGQNGVNHPVIAWGNGTGSTPSAYSSLLHHMASHGFIVAAANTTNAGTGEAMLSCVDQALSQYSGNVDPNRIGTSGHSQGGGGAIMAGQDPRVTATAPMQPYQLGLGHDTSSQRNQNGPMFLMSGSSDSIAGTTLNQGPIFRRSNVPTFWGILQGAGHFEPTGDGGDFRGPTTAWFRHHLMDDAGAAQMFNGSNCTLCTHGDWEVQKKSMN